MNRRTVHSTYQLHSVTTSSTYTKTEGLIKYSQNISDKIQQLAADNYYIYFYSLLVFTFIYLADELTLMSVTFLTFTLNTHFT